MRIQLGIESGAGRGREHPGCLATGFPLDERARCGRTMNGAGLLLIVFLSGCRATPAPPLPASAPASAPAGQPPDRTIRVLLLDELQQATISLPDDFNVVDPTTQTILRAGQPACEVTAVFTSDSIHLDPIAFATSSTLLDLVPASDRPVRVKLTSDWREFRGSIRLLRQETGGAVISLVDIEDYLLSVVSSELPKSFQRETFRAQAVAARTYAWYARQTVGRKREWDVWATEKSQVYSGIERETLVPRAVEAVRDTPGIVLTWSAPQGDRIFCTYFSSRCGGTTTSVSSVRREPAIPPLAGGVVCEFCRRSDSYRWPQDARFTKQQVRQRLAERYVKFAELGRIQRVEVTASSPEGRATRITCFDKAGASQDIEAENFRLTVDPTGRLIQSTWFTIADELDAITLIGGRGMGHGMGLCQYGAEAMAKAGHDVASILRYYYPGSKLTRAY